MFTFAEGRAIAKKIAEITTQSVYDFQGKVVADKNWLKDIIGNYGIVNLKDIHTILDALKEDPFVGYEPIAQVCYNNPTVVSILEKHGVRAR